MFAEPVFAEARAFGVVAAVVSVVSSSSQLNSSSSPD